MHVTIGRIVHYSLTEGDLWDHVEERSHVNAHAVGQLLPAIVVAVIKEVQKGRGEVVNLQVFLDGQRTAWIQGVYPGNEPGQWRWPEREPVAQAEPTAAETVKDVVHAALASVTPPTA